MERLKSFENYVNETLYRSEDDPSASLNYIPTKSKLKSKPTEWNDIQLTPNEIKFLMYVYNTYGSGGPVAVQRNWKNIGFNWGKTLMKKTIDGKGKFKDLSDEETISIAKGILNKMESNIVPKEIVENPKKWDDITLTPNEIKFLIFIYNNFDSGGPMADEYNWQYIEFKHGKNMMNKVINDKYKNLSSEKVKPIATSILNKMK